MLDELLEELAAKLIEKESIPDILENAFAQQKEFIKDKTKQKVLFCTRRSAKSFTAGLYLVVEALRNPGCNCLFIGLTRASAKAIIWKDILSIIDQKYSLGASFNQTELTMTLPNGSVISVTGVDVDEAEMYKLLGRKYRLVCIDEASMYTIDVRNLVYGVLSPAMVDPNENNESGTICLMGTASNFPRGLFYDVTVGKENGWKLFSWTAYDNPYVAAKWEEALEKIRVERPLYMETPQYKQWYLNQWVIDEEKLVYRFDMGRNLTNGIPHISRPETWTYVLGVDTGWEDDSAFVLTAYHENDPNLYILKTFHRKKMFFEDKEGRPDFGVVDKIRQFMADPVYAPHKVIIDGANKQGVESMKQRSAIPFEYADKQDKATFIELCNSDLIQGNIKIIDKPENRPLWDEMASLVWVTDGDKIKYPKKEHPALSNHLCFIAGTKVLTPNGEINIESLKVGDLVTTENGINSIQAIMNSKADTVKLTLNTGETIVCTPNHPFKVCDTWIPAKDLLHKCLTTRNIFSVKEKSILKELNIPKRKLNIFIERFGNIIMDQFRKVSTFITKMKIDPIIKLKISSAYQQGPTSENIKRSEVTMETVKETWNTWITSEAMQVHGIDPKKVDNGIGSIMRYKNVNLIEENGINEVYNISVANDPTYYINDILVSNCDAFLYAWRCGYHYASIPAAKKITVGSRDWYMKQSESIWEKEREYLEKQGQRGDWPSEGSLGELG